MVSWLVLGAVVSGSMRMQSEVEGSAMATACWATTTSSSSSSPPSCCVSGLWYSGEGGFISRTSSLPFSTLGGTQHLCHECPRRPGWATCWKARDRPPPGLANSISLWKGALPAVSRSGVCGHVVKLHLPPHHVFAHLHSCDTACVPLPVHTHLHVQPFI